LTIFVKRITVSTLLNMAESIEKVLEKFPPHKKELLIPILQEIQAEEGFLTHECLEKVGKYVGVPSNKIYGVATFYDQFRFRAHGKYHFQVCQGTNCYLFGSTTLVQEVEKLLQVKAGSTSRDGKFSLEVASCLGACSHSPVVLINGQPCRTVTPESLSKIIATLKD
jgi:NADH-quinone oxidoreductase E subunit